MDKIRLVALGGLDEDGKDLYVIEINDNIFVLNAGFKYPTKLTPGIDFLISDFTYLKQNKEKIRAYILSKSKIINFGALPYIYKECPAPIYCTTLTKKFLTEFSKQYGQECDYKFNVINLPAEVNISGFDFTFFSTCASVPSTFGFAIKTNLGNIVYSGDFIVEYNNEKYFKLDLNTVGKIAESPTLILLSESINSDKPGYCSPNHKISPFLDKCFNGAPGRCFVALSSDNLYRINEFINVCNKNNKKVCFYDKETEDVYNLRKNGEDYFDNVNLVTLDNILRVKEDELVILIVSTEENIYEKISLLCSGENEAKNVRLGHNDTFILGLVANDNNEVIATSTIDEVYKTSCHVRYIDKKSLRKMHACEEDLKMLISLLKPKYYFPIQGYYVSLLNNAKIAFDMRIGLSHSNIFLLDNGQSLTLTENSADVDFNFENEHVQIGEVMIDGIGVGDVVNEIISDRTRLSEDGVIVLACAVSCNEQKIMCGPDVQMRGFLYLKDKEAESMIRDMSQYFVESVNNWLISSSNVDIFTLQKNIKDDISKTIKKQLNREPVVKVNIIAL